MLTDFIRSIPKEHYKITGTSQKWLMEFIQFEYILADSSRKNIDEFIGLIGCTGEDSNGFEFTKLNDNIINVKKLKLIFHEPAILDYIKKKLAFSDVNIIFSLLNEGHKKYLQPSYINTQLVNIFINPFWVEEIHNSYIIITNNEEIKINQIDIQDKVEEIKKNSTVMIEPYILPDYYIKNDQIIDNSVEPLFVLYVLCSICSFSKKDERREKYIIGIKGYRSITIEFIENEINTITKSLNNKNLITIYNWIFEEKFFETRLSIIRNLLTLDNESLKTILEKLTNIDFLTSAKNHFELVIQGSIKEHFENLDKANTKVQNFISQIDDHINKTTSSLNAIAFGILGFLITTSTRIVEFNSIILMIFSGVLFFYVLIVKYLIYPNLRESKEQAYFNILQLRSEMTNKLKIISQETATKLLDEPIENSSNRFNKILDRFTHILDIIAISIILFFIIILFFK